MRRFKNSEAGQNSKCAEKRITFRRIFVQRQRQREFSKNPPYPFTLKNTRHIYRSCIFIRCKHVSRLADHNPCTLSSQAVLSLSDCPSARTQDSRLTVAAPSVIFTQFHLSCAFRQRRTSNGNFILLRLYYTKAYICCQAKAAAFLNNTKQKSKKAKSMHAKRRSSDLPQ